ncbi:hypothetical protein E2542_SST13221 [Spatholobus suberectus]|nr:hypothetical protein E2542_SST13221 [Spatholobus suberectus]
MIPSLSHTHFRELALIQICALSSALRNAAFRPTSGCTSALDIYWIVRRNVDFLKRVIQGNIGRVLRRDCDFFVEQ